MKNNPAIHYILKTSKPIWPKGHQLLSAIGTYSRSLHEDPVIKKMFASKKYYCERTYNNTSGITRSDWYDTKTQSFVLRRDNEFKKDGRVKLPSYFSSFGVLSSLGQFVKKKKAAEERVKKTKTASLTTKQKKAVNLALDCIRKVAPTFSKLYKNHIEDEGIYENFNKDGELTIRSNRKRSLKHGVMETFDLMREKKNYEYGYVNGTYEYFGMGPIDKNMSLLIKGSYISLKKIEKKGVVKKIEKDTEYMLSYLKDKKIDRANVTGVGFFFGLNRISLKNGCWEYFGKDGKLITRKYFKNGKLTTKKLHEKKISLQDSQ